MSFGKKEFHFLGIEAEFGVVKVSRFPCYSCNGIVTTCKSLLEGVINYRVQIHFHSELILPISNKVSGIGPLCRDTKLGGMDCNLFNKWVRVGNIQDFLEMDNVPAFTKLGLEMGIRILVKCLEAKGSGWEFGLVKGIYYGLDVEMNTWRRVTNYGFNGKFK